MISNDEFYHLVNDENNIAIAKSILKRFKLSIDERREIYLISLWKAAEKYKKDNKYKFSTYLCNSIIFQYLHLYRSNQHKIKTFGFRYGLDDPAINDSNIDELLEIAGPYKDILKMKYINNMTLVEIAEKLGCCHEKVRLMIKKGIQHIRDFYEAN